LILICKAQNFLGTRNVIEEMLNVLVVVAALETGLVVDGQFDLV
jgi:uncharacterized membrane protein YuzA (DUF378 family)